MKNCTKREYVSGKSLVIFRDLVFQVKQAP